MRTGREAFYFLDGSHRLRLNLLGELGYEGGRSIEAVGVSEVQVEDKKRRGDSQRWRAGAERAAGPIFLTWASREATFFVRRLELGDGVGDRRLLLPGSGAAAVFLEAAVASGGVLGSRIGFAKFHAVVAFGMGGAKGEAAGHRDSVAGASRKEGEVGPCNTTIDRSQTTSHTLD